MVILWIFRLLYNIIPYTLDKETELIDMDEVKDLL